MRFLELYLKAFGPFSERAPIQFPDVGGPGLCVIYGSNEAGKSTALRAIRGLLYGIPTKTPDDFVHRYADLRIGARLRFDDGEELAVMRHKKTKDSLYSYDDLEVLRSERLERLVETVPESLFGRFYGLDHPGLREGSAALLQDDGEVGRALFGAGLGVSNLHGVLDGLERDAVALFAARASKPRLNANLAEWSKTQKEISQASLDPKAWAELDRQVRACEARVDEIARQISDGRRDLSRLERLKRSLPALARRSAARLRLEELGSTPSLPLDFSEGLTTARADRRSADEGRRRAEAKIERETAARASLSLAPELLAEQERIELLHQRVSGVAEAVEQLPRRQSKLAALDAEIEALLLSARSSLTAERLALIRGAVAQTSTVRALANEGVKCEERLSKAREEAADADILWGRLRSELAGDRVPADEIDSMLADPRALRVALGRSLKLGSLDDRIAEEQRDHEAIDFEVERRGRALGLAVEAAVDIDSASFPGHELIESMAESFSAGNRRRAAIGDEALKIRSERRLVEEALARHQSSGAVPQLSDLEEQRAERDRTWRSLRRGVIDADVRAEAVSVPGETSPRELADRFERDSARADLIGDRLRIDAERVAEYAALVAKAARLDLDLADLQEREKLLVAEGLALEARWSEIWSSTGVKAGIPEEMRGWRRGFDELIGFCGQRREAAMSIERCTCERSDGIRSIRAALEQTPGWAGFEAARLDEWVAHAEWVLGRLEEAAETRRRDVESARLAEQRAAESGERVRRADATMSEWRGEWGEALSRLDLPPDTRPARALERLDELGRLLERLRERGELDDRVAKMGVDIRSFEDEVRELVGLCAAELVDYPSGPAVKRLQRMLGDALKQQALFGKCTDAIREATEELEDAAARMRASDDAIVALCGLAGVAEEADLDDALRFWRAVEETQATFRQAEAELANLAEGRSIAELEAETTDSDSDLLAAQITSLEERLLQRTRDEKRAIEELRSLRDALEAMDGSGRVAELAEVAESKLTEIRRDVDRYVELRMAKQILQDQIERYRNQNQAPLLTRAGEIFGALTLGAYPKIESDMDGTGSEIRLMAVAAGIDGKSARVPVGGLSAGTRDQLFLAIRLASLEEAMRRGESMPLIADDILIEFDDARSRATLEVLAEMGRKNQILLFSHHLHVAEIARDLNGKAAVIDL